MSRKVWYIIAPVLSGLLIFFDQFTKYLARRDLAEGGYSIIEDVFKLALVKNKGAAWGILQGRVDILSIVSIILIILLVFLFFRIPDGKRYNILRILISAVFSGAVGNQIDRFVFGYVTDFLYFELIDFPVFNVADCYITISMVVFVFLMLLYYKDEDVEFLSFRKRRKENSQKQEKEKKEAEEETAGKAEEDTAGKVEEKTVGKAEEEITGQVKE